MAIVVQELLPDGPDEPHLEPLAEEWKAFGWSCVESDGHDAEAIAAVVSLVPFQPVQQAVVIAHRKHLRGNQAAPGLHREQHHER